MAGPADETPWLRILAWIHAALLILLFLESSIALAIFALEALLVIFWLLPVFLYQVFAKRLPVRESIKRAAESLTNAITYL